MQERFNYDFAIIPYSIADFIKRVFSCEANIVLSGRISGITRLRLNYILMIFFFDSSGFFNFILFSLITSIVWSL